MLESILIWLLIGAVAGWLAGVVVKGGGFGLPGDIVVGIVGAFIGGWLGSMLTGSGLNGFSLWSMVLAIVGAMLLLWIYRLATRNRTASL